MKMRAVLLIALVSVAVGAASCQGLPDADATTNRRMMLSQKRALAQVTPLNSRLRVDGLGIAGAKLTELLGNINAFAREVPRLGSDASTSSTSSGDESAQRRTTSVVLRTLPLATSGRADGGTGVTSDSTSGPGVTGFKSNSTSVAKDIANDKNGEFKSFGSSADAEGFTVATSNSARPSASSTTGSTTTDAGEKALRTLPFDRVLDGAQANSRVSQSGIGDRVTTRLQAAALAALASAKDAVSKLDDKNGTKVDDKNVTLLAGPDPKSQFGGAYLFAAADSVDGRRSATRDFDKAANTAVNLATNSFINRYGYSAANDAATVTVDSTKTGASEVLGGRFGTGYNFGTVATTTSTYPEQMKGKLKPAPPKPEPEPEPKPEVKPEDEPKH